MVWAALALVGGAALLTASTAGAQSLDEVVGRVVAYVAAYEQDLATVVAEEHYVQRLDSRNPDRHVSRTLRSDIALVRSADREEWIAFRDVYEVDGAAVRNRDDRLRQLFFDPPPDVLARARVIADEGARYNLGSVMRNFNVPTAVLSFLHPANASRFRFRKVAERRTGQVTTWDVSFEERDRPTIIRTPGGRNIPSRGTLRVAPDSGRILETALRIEDPDSRIEVQIVVTFAPDEGLGVWVPSVMRESYTHPAQTIGAEATYSDFRRFRVDVRIRETGRP